MKNFLIALVIGLVVLSCSNPNEKEIGEVDALISIVEDTEKSLLSVDTFVVFSAKRQMDKNIAELNVLKDTINREEAFKLNDIFSNKKQLNTIMINYKGFIQKIDLSKNQLNNLKQDLENGLMNKENFQTNYAVEQGEVMLLNSQINKVVESLDLVLEKLELDQPALQEILERRRLKATNNE